MFNTKSILSQMQAFISGYEFEKCVSEYNGDKGVKSFTTKNLLGTMIYFHSAGKRSLRDICDSLKSKSNLWYHLGLKNISRNNLSYALQKRNSEIFEKTFYQFFGKVQNIKNPQADKRFKFKNKLLSIDSTVISLCLSLFDWAHFRKSKGGIKLHTMFDNKNQIPEFVYISEARVHDAKVIDKFIVSKNSIYVMDKAYLKFKYLNKINKNKGFFVIRTKSNTQYKKISANKRTHNSIKADWEIKLTGSKAEDYSGKLRLVKYYDKEKKRTFEYLTNNFKLSAMTIADIYKSRWDIELFFKCIKQHLKIKTFIGTSENAVRIQIWTSLITFLLVEYLRYLSRSSFSFLKAFRLLSTNIFHNMEIDFLLKPPDNNMNPNSGINDHQLCLNF